MNFLFLHSGEETSPNNFSLREARASYAQAQHRCVPSEEIWVVVEDRGRAKARVLTSSSELVVLEVQSCEGPIAQNFPHLIVGLSRPQTIKKVLELAAALGVPSIAFVATERGEKSYQSATVLEPAQMQTHLVRGAEQAGECRLPEVRVYSHLKKYLGEVFPHGGPQPGLAILADTAAAPRLEVALHNSGAKRTAFAAIGPEAGWSDGEREMFLTRQFISVSLGPRILRVEHALGLLAGQLQLLSDRSS